MKITTSELNNTRKWRSSTGITKEQFYQLLPIFEAVYVETYGKTIATKEQESNTTFCLRTEEDLLYFTLFSMKSGLTYDLLGIVCGMDSSNAKRNQDTGLKLLKAALEKGGYMPKRHFSNKQEFDAFFEGIDTLIIDATEQQKQRPVDNEIQKNFYSGKKNAIP